MLHFDFVSILLKTLGFTVAVISPDSDVPATDPDGGGLANMVDVPATDPDGGTER